MESLVVVTHPEPLRIEARPMNTVETPEGSVALGYYHEGRVLARGLVAEEALDAIAGLLTEPVSLALAATEDEHGNIDARVCLVLPVDADELRGQEEADGSDEPWKASVPAAPELGAETWEEGEEDEDGQPRLALLPIGNAVRGARDRHHEDLVADAREMLENLLAGRSRDAVDKAIDDLLSSL
ncbi:MAG TPA: hypothetical protein VK939_12945 [Longimicrobiales bacterium]|nr:hypothetical protein [Longimicrobiales bacterium]